MTYANICDVIKANKDAIIGKMIEMDALCKPWKLDLYVYPDGELYVYDNVGGNSWLNDDHVRFWSIDNSCTDNGGQTYEERLNVCMEDYDTYDAEYDACLEILQEKEERL